MSEIRLEEHHSPIQTPRQLIVAVVLAFVVPIAIIVLLTQFLTVGIKLDPDSPLMTDEYVAERLRPVGQLVVADAKVGAQAAKSGEEVTKAVCAACHATGALNAPKIGDSAAWGKVAAQGLEKLTEHAIKGIRQMPARGGNPSLSDLEVARAIVYMANQSGQNLKEPAAPAEAKTDEAKAAAPAVAATAPAPASASPAASATLDGKAIYEKNCAACHMTGAANAPKAGDKVAWEPRLKASMDTLHEHAIKGKGAMPPKGGNASLSDAEVKAAVNYLVGLAK
jgi:cytochrome c5